MKKGALVGLVLCASLAVAQPIEKDQLWVGAITQVRVGEHALIWNDSHYVPGGFFIIRSGYVRETSIGRFAVGLAHLWLPDSETTMQRDEWRPWGQWMHTKSLNDQWQVQTRVRYEARFRELLVDGRAISNEFGFNNRFRLQGVVRRNVVDFSESNKLFVAAGGELLLNQGRDVYWLDQHRRTITMGITHKKMNFQTGYMNRQNFAATGDKSQIAHTWVNWLVIEI